MAATLEDSKWVRATIAIAVAAAAAAAAISTLAAYVYKKRSEDLEERVQELHNSLITSLQKCAAERKGRTKAQQALRKTLTENNGKSKKMSYPMTPIGIIQSCFSTRYGTPRQPLLVPLARACLIFDTSLVPPAALEGLSEYSHCWIIYVFHLNTDLEKLWRPPCNSKFKAKVRVPKLKGGRMGVFATRSPHRPCPIGLTVAKIEAVQGNVVLLSGVDLVDGTPVLDIKPYLPYCESVKGATVPKWVKEDNLLAASVDFSPEFSSSLANCWLTAEKRSLYASPDEIKSLTKQVLSWDIRSLSQRIRPHNVCLKADNNSEADNNLDLDEEDDEVFSHGNAEGPFPSSTNVTYHLMLEDLDISYTIDCDGNVLVEKTILSLDSQRRQHRCSYEMWRDRM